MGEIIQISIGQFGNQVGLEFWEQMKYEHKIDYNGKLVDSAKTSQQILTFFEEHINNKYLARSMQLDLGSECLDKIRCLFINNCLSPDSLINSQYSSAGNFAKASYEASISMFDQTNEIIRRQIENCDRFQGFQITHSLSGGAGSGLTHLLISKFQDIYNPKLLQTHTLFPSYPSHSILEPYNAVLGINSLIEYSTLTHVIDNVALEQNISQNISSNNNKSYNEIIADSMCQVSCSNRFNGQLNGGLCKLQTNLVYFPRLHFIPHTLLNHRSNLTCFVNNIFDIKYMSASLEGLINRYICGALIFRGTHQMYQIEELTKSTNQYLWWLKHPQMVSQCNECDVSGQTSAMFIGNPIQFYKYFNKLDKTFMQMFRRKAFLYKYLEYGLEEQTFIEAEQNMCDLNSLYPDYDEVEQDEFEQQL